MTKTVASGPDFPRPLTTVDVVIFTALNDHLHVLLVKRADEALFRAKDAGRDRIWAFQGQFYEDVPQPR